MASIPELLPLFVAGYDWNLSIWQMEVSLTQIFDRPWRGREFLEEIIRDHLDHPSARVRV